MTESVGPDSAAVGANCVMSCVWNSALDPLADRSQERSHMRCKTLCAPALDGCGLRRSVIANQHT